MVTQTFDKVDLRKKQIKHCFIESKKPRQRQSNNGKDIFSKRIHFTATPDDESLGIIPPI